MAKVFQSLRIEAGQNGYAITESYREDAPKKDGIYLYMPDDPPVYKETVEGAIEYAKECLTKNAKPAKRYAAQSVSSKSVSKK